MSYAVSADSRPAPSIYRQTNFPSALKEGKTRTGINPLACCARISSPCGLAQCFTLSFSYYILLAIFKLILNFSQNLLKLPFAPFACL